MRVQLRMQLRVCHMGVVIPFFLLLCSKIWHKDLSGRDNTHGLIKFKSATFEKVVVFFKKMPLVIIKKRTQEGKQKSSTPRKNNTAWPGAIYFCQPITTCLNFTIYYDDWQLCQGELVNLHFGPRHPASQWPHTNYTDTRNTTSS